MDVETVVENHAAWLAALDYPADNLPLFNPNLGPEITATLYGCDLTFSEHSSWSSPIIHDPADWDRILQLSPDFSNIYWQTLERLTDYALEVSQQRFLVGLTDLHGNYDILAALRDPQMLCMDVLDCPETLRRVGRHVSRGYNTAFRRCYDKLARAGYGSSCWTPAYHPGPAYVPSSDFWCMVSPAVAKNLILPDILTELEPLERSVFHLDGPQALPHLDLLLAIPQLNAIQWIYGAGHGPAAKWIDVYRRCLQAGKAVQVMVEDPKDALTILQAVGPKGLWLCGGYFSTLDEANAYLRDVERASLSHHG